MDAGTLLTGTVLGAILSSIAWYVQRRLSRADETEDAARYANYTKIAADLKKENLTLDEVGAVATYLQEKRKGKRVAEVIAEDRQESEEIWTQAQMNGETFDREEAARDLVEQRSTELKRLISPAEAKHLAAMESAFTKFIDASRAFAMSEFESSSIAPAIGSTEVQRLYEDRAAWLQVTIADLKNRHR